jgi:Asp-tRNA(Asn)/Glu-tRNA(Gln) amidotransferase A subunit family amidase
MTRTVRDAALMLSAIAGPDPRDPMTLEAPPTDYLAACDGDLKGLRVAWSADFGYAPLEPEVRSAPEAAARGFGALGCAVEEVTPGWDDPAPFARVLWHCSMAWRHGERYAQRPEWFEPSMAEMIEAGRRCSSEEIGRAWLARSAFYERALRFMDGYDLLLTPQMPSVAWRHDDPAPVIGGAPRPGIFDRVPFTFPFNLTGWPAASVPCGLSSDGLPIALQVVAPWHRDDLCLRAAARFEEMQPWAHLRPPL